MSVCNKSSFHLYTSITVTLTIYFGPILPRAHYIISQLRTCGVFWHRKFMREDEGPAHKTKLRVIANSGVLATYKKQI